MGAATAEAQGAFRILVVEDAAHGADLLIRQLQAAGLTAIFRQVASEAGLRRAMAEFAPDIVLSSMDLPGLQGTRVLDIVRSLQPALPFIYVADLLAEEAAVATLQRGADDYIIRQQTARLPTAVMRAIGDARQRRDRSRVESELMRAQRLESLSMLAAGLSHDLRNILQPLLIMPELLKARTDDPKLHHFADVIAECGRRGHEMAQSMLSFVRGSQAASEVVPIPHLFDAVELLLRANLPPSVTLELSVDDPSLAVRANYTEMQQVLLNLCLNGLQAMPHGGRLWLDVRARAGHEGADRLCLSVTDEGTGMSADILARLFNPFFTTKADGTGLGLMSCKRIVEGCGGQITVASELGRGTRFMLDLPIAAASPLPRPAFAALAPGAGQSIFVVDGEATRLSLLGNALSSQGYLLRLASDGATALRWMQQGAMPALVVVDGGARLLPARHLLDEMALLGFAGAVLLLEDPEVEVPDAFAPPTLHLHVLRKPLEMEAVFRAVAQALG
ncbi:ATP-binding protein [Xanthomonas sp. 60]